MAALRFPADRISQSKSYLPSMRFIEEYVQTYKFSVRLRLLGFTLNPEHIGNDIMGRVLDKVPKAEIVILKRRNLVKLAVSGTSCLA